jgi:hypothetical protein
MSYEEKTYVVTLREQVQAFLASLDQEFVKQSRRTNRESEKRTRKLLGSFYKTVALPYKKSSLDDLKAEEGTVTETTVADTTVVTTEIPQ